MHKIEWTPAALGDVREIRNTIAKNSPENAKRFAARLIKAPQALRRFPESGALSDAWPGSREIYAGNYRIIYRVKAKSVEVLGVIHSSRQFP